MCGIVGIFGGKIDRLTSANQALAHRGPDDSGVFIDSFVGVGLGHRRLSILDPSPQGHQPMLSSDGKLVLVFNGEIYNFRELRSQLELKGIVFRGHSDTEVLLRLYESEGEKILSLLNGIFAFAIWDSSRKALLIARDALGIKPLYYAALPKCFAFSSEIKALLKLVPEVCGLDAEALHRYLSFVWCPGEGTPLKSVRKLGPGEAMWVHGGRVDRHWTWYQLPVFRGTPVNLSCQDAIRGTASHLRQAVRRQVVADVPVGAFLSGGLDSSAIVAFAREQNPDIRCFTIEASGGSDDGSTDDLPYARQVATHLKVPLDMVRIDADHMAEDLAAMVTQLDEPIADPATLNALYISRLAREQGIKVLLSGAGGDDIFTGYRRHLALMSEDIWSWLPRPARKGLEVLTNCLDQHRPLFRRLRKLFSGASLDDNARLINYFRWVDQRDLMSLYTPEFMAALGDAHAEDPMLAFLAEIPPQTSRLERMLALEQRFFLADHNLIYTDKMSMAAGVEVRVPFLDLELVEFAARMPARYSSAAAKVSGY